jgi:hypothetical protein
VMGAWDLKFERFHWNSTIGDDGGGEVRGKLASLN